MCKNFFCVFESFCHIGVLAVQSSRKWILASLSFEIDVCNKFLFAGKNDFRFISKVDLNNFIAEPEHDCVLGFHPLFNINISWREVSALSFGFVLIIKIVSEML